MGLSFYVIIIEILWSSLDKGQTEQCQELQDSFNHQI